jgi:hypothetical protein
VCFVRTCRNNKIDIFFVQISIVWHSYILLPIGTNNPEVVVSLNAALIYLVENVTKVVMKAPNVLVLMTPRTNALAIVE